MACCVLIAALFGGVAIIRAKLTRGGDAAQDWRLFD